MFIVRENRSITPLIYPMANELTCLDFSYFRLYVTFPQSQQELLLIPPLSSFPITYLADFLLHYIPDYHKSIRRRNNYSGFKMW